MRGVLSRLTVSLLAPALAVVTMPTLTGCKKIGGAAETLLPEQTNPITANNQTQCKIRASQQRPLIVEWPSADRAALESQTRKGLVVVAYHGCQMEVKRQCMIRGRYRFAPVTPKEDQVKMQSADDLYMHIPTYAAKFEAKLARAGQLNVNMTIVGMYEADRAMVQIDELVGNCKGATHVVTAIAAGAYEFYSGAAAEVGADLNVLNRAGAGAKSQAKRESLSRDGDPGACADADLMAVAPPAKCGALLRLEVVELTVPDGMEAPPAIAALEKNEGNDSPPVVTPQPQPQPRPQPQPQPKPEPRPEPRQKDAPANPGRGLIISGAVLGALGVGALAGMGAGLGLGAKAEDDFTSGDPGDRSDTDDRGKLMNTLAISLGAVGGVLAATGVALVLVGLKRRKSAVAVTPTFGPGMAGLSLSTRF